MKLVLGFFLAIFSLQANASLIEISQSQKNSQIEKFVQDVEAKLPQKMKDVLSSKKKKITLSFVNVAGDTNQIKAPDCNNIVDSFSRADEVTAEYKSVLGAIKGKSLRYNKQVQSYTDKNNNIYMNAGFMSVIQKGESSAQTYACEHRNLYRLAQGALINAIASIYDDSFTQTVKQGNKTSTVRGVSESLKYMVINGWNKKEKLQHGFWPRAVNPYEFAAGPAENFALNMEFYLLDSEYACRRPLQQDFFVRHFGQDPLAAQRTCTVNYVLKIPHAEALEREDSGKVTQKTINEVLRSYDLSPDRVLNINYLRAGASTGAGSFGHAMFKFESCAPGQPLSSQCTKENYSLVINPRANPLEMRLDNLRGFFGGYPSMFLVTPMREIRNEYGQRELRHLYSIPLTGGKFQDPATGQTLDVLSEAQKTRLIHATLDQYWTYYGKYKFLSNNCADEAMRLYQMSSDDPQVLGLNILMPQQFNQKLSQLGLADEAKTKGLEPASGVFKKLLGALFKKDVKWADFEKKYQAAADSGANTTFLSFQYDIMKSVRMIMIAEGRSEKEYNSSKTLAKESKKWVKIAIPEIDLDDAALENFRKTGVLSEEEYKKTAAALSDIPLRYNAITENASPQQVRDAALAFHRLIHLIIQKRRDAVGNEAVRLAYEIAYPKKEKQSELVLHNHISADQVEKIKAAIDGYAKIQRALMPYRELSTQPGYGIPLESEITRGEEFSKYIVDEYRAMDSVLSSLEGVLYSQQVIRRELEMLQDAFTVHKETAEEALKNK